VLEPLCGKGVFLDSLKKQGFQNISAYEVDESLRTEYPFVRYSSFVASPLSEKFDAVIGNPPYIRWKNLEENLKEELRKSDIWNTYFNSLCDYLFIFILKSIEQLNDNGELIFICNEYWLNSTHAESLRDYMTEHGFFTDIYHFKEAPVFDDASTSVIIFRYVKTAKMKGKNIRLHMYCKNGEPERTDLFSGACFTVSDIPQFRQGERWRLISRIQQTDLRKFEAKCEVESDLFSREIYRIGDVCEIGNGMVSGLDAVFRLPEDKKLNDDERQCTISVLKAKDLLPYTHLETTDYIFMNDADEPITEEIFRMKYPYFHEKLSPFIQNLNSRYRYKRDIPYWEFVFPRNKKMFEESREKIFIPCKERISHKKYFRFSLVEGNVYPLQDVTCLVKKTGCKESIEYLLTYLNSKEVFDWLTVNGIVKGNIVEFSEKPVSQIPFRKINWENPAEAELHRKITLHTNRYIKHGTTEDLQMANENMRMLLNG